VVCAAAALAYRALAWRAAACTGGAGDSGAVGDARKAVLIPMAEEDAAAAEVALVRPSTEMAPVAARVWVGGRSRRPRGTPWPGVEAALPDDDAIAVG